MRYALLSCLILTAFADSLSAQSAEALVGRDVRVWTQRAPAPITGVITHSNDSFLRISSGRTVCTVDGCSKFVGSPWSEVDHLQVNGSSRSARVARAVTLTAGALAIVVVGTTQCTERSRSKSDLNDCWQGMVGVTAATAGVGYLVSRPSWSDVAVPGRQ
jgi:hypothetical protein